MTQSDLTEHADSLRYAVEGQDFMLAQKALQDYVACFQSCPRSLAEIDVARNLIQWGLEMTSAHKTHIAEELMHLRTIFDAYLPPALPHTWRLDG